MYLRSWWSRTYNRPLKDPLLDTYTLEELYYEYCDNCERINAASEKAEEEDDRIEEEKYNNALSWAEEEEQREIEELRQKKEKEWMEKQLKKNKEELGENFGEDLSINFSEV